MSIKKSISKLILVCLVCVYANINAQTTAVYKIDGLLKRIHNSSDTTYIVNFWATWCKPCVAELPEFEKLHTAKYHNVKVLLICMDFKEELNKKVKTFLDKNKYTAEVILLDEVNGNDFINKISEKWSGAIPATLVTKRNPWSNEFIEGKITAEKLAAMILAK